MKKAVIFDMDGTLLRTELILEESLHQTLLELDKYQITYIEQPMKKYNEIMGVPLDEVWKELLLDSTEDNRVLANEIFQNALIGCIESVKAGFMMMLKKHSDISSLWDTLYLSQATVMKSI